MYNTWTYDTKSKTCHSRHIFSLSALPVNFIRYNTQVRLGLVACRPYSRLWYRAEIACPKLRARIEGVSPAPADYSASSLSCSKLQKPSKWISAINISLSCAARGAFVRNTSFSCLLGRIDWWLFWIDIRPKSSNITRYFLLSITV